MFLLVFICMHVSHVQACLVHTTETIRVRYFMDRLLEHRRPVMLVGNAGTGKSVLVGDKLGSLDAEKYMIKNVPFNYYTTSAMLQGMSPTLTRDSLTVNCMNIAIQFHLSRCWFSPSYISALCSYIPLPHSGVGKAPWEESRAQLWTSWQPKTDLLHRRHEYAWGGRLWHGATSHSHTPTHGLQPLVRRCHLHAAMHYICMSKHECCLKRITLRLDCVFLGDFQKISHQRGNSFSL